MFSGAFDLVLFSVLLFLFSGSISLPIALLITCWSNPSLTDVFHDGISSHAYPFRSDRVSCPSLKQPKTSAEDSTQKFSLISEPSLSLWTTYPESETLRSNARWLAMQSTFCWTNIMSVNCSMDYDNESFRWSWVLIGE